MLRITWLPSAPGDGKARPPPTHRSAGTADLARLAVVHRLLLLGNKCKRLLSLKAPGPSRPPRPPGGGGGALLLLLNVLLNHLLLLRGVRPLSLLGRPPMTHGGLSRGLTMRRLVLFLFVVVSVGG